MKQIKAEQTIGIIGGGQLGRMLAQSAKTMGYQVGILDPGENSSAGQVADFQVVAAFDDIDALRQFAADCDLVTFEFENIDVDSLDQLIEEDAIYLPQGTRILKATQNRLDEKVFIESAGVEVAPFVKVESLEDLKAGIEKLGYPAVLKTTRFGYDGKGQVVIKSEADFADCQELIDKQTCILEGWVPFEKELSVMVARNQQGQMTVYPVSENIHVNNILHQSIVPARVSDKARQAAKEVAEKLAEAIDLVGILGIELFMLKDGQVLANELAPRPHNSGHYSIEACDFSQFDSHIKAVTGQAMGQPKLLSDVVMVNVLGQHVDGVEVAAFSQADWHIHLYGKGAGRHNRKMGHVTILTEDINQTLTAVDQSQIWSEI